MNKGLHSDMLDTIKRPRADRLTSDTADAPKGRVSKIIDMVTSAGAFLQRLFRRAPDITPGILGDTADAPAERVSGVADTAPAMIEVVDSQPVSCTGLAFRTEAGSRPEPIDRTGSDPGMDELAQPLPAPNAMVEGGRFETGSYGNEAGNRAYKLYIPSGYHGQALPLVVMLHGSTQSADDFAAGTRMNALAEEHTCLIVYPEQAVSANALKSWNWYSPSDQQRDQGEPSLIAGITRRIMQVYPVDAQRVYVAGLSAGAAAAAILGETYPDLYAAIGVHSGLARGAASGLFSAFAAMRRGGTADGERSDGASGGGTDLPVVPTIVFHGDQDTTVHPRNGDQVIARLRATAGPDLQTQVQHGKVPGGHAYSRTLQMDPSGQALSEQWVIHGAGHAWSGGNLAGSYTDPRGPDAAREMLRFFFEHPHSAAA